MGSRVQMDRLYLERIGPQRVSGELLFHPRFLRIPCYDSLMRHLVVLLIHFLATLVRLLGPGGVRSIVAESLLLKHQLLDRKSTRLNSSHGYISYAVFCLKKKKKQNATSTIQ